MLSTIADTRLLTPPIRSLSPYTSAAPAASLTTPTTRARPAPPVAPISTTAPATAAAATVSAAAAINAPTAAPASAPQKLLCLMALPGEVGGLPWPGSGKSGGGLGRLPACIAPTRAMRERISSRMTTCLILR